MIWILFIGMALAGGLVQWRLRSKFTKYAQTPLSSGLSGREVAEKMLRDSGIYDVQVVSVDGFLSDHYNPEKKTVNLSPEVYSGRSVASAAVAAHECGHAVQHATAYAWLNMRSSLVPVVSVASKYLQWVILGGILLLQSPFGQGLLLAGILMYAATTLFSFITLPVEFDASNRALAWLDQTRLTNQSEHSDAKDALKWAAMTYVVAAISSLITLLYYLSIFLRSRD